MKSARSRRITAGVTLIGLGLGLYVFQRFEGMGEAAVFVVIGAAFLAAYLYNRVYGYLVPAGILLGLGTGTVLGHQQHGYGDPTLLGLGGGFVLIFVVALIYERKSHWWPLIPGAALILAGLPMGSGIFEYLFENWPLILVVIGALILVGGLGRKGSGSSSSTE